MIKYKVHNFMLIIKKNKDKVNSNAKNSDLFK